MGTLTASLPCCHADGAKVAATRRALGGHALYGYSTAKSGVFGEDCLSVASSAAARLGEQRRAPRRGVAGGAFFFGYFLLGKQQKVTRQSGETDVTYGAMLFGYSTLRVLFEKLSNERNSENQFFLCINRLL